MCGRVGEVRARVGTVSRIDDRKRGNSCCFVVVVVLVFVDGLLTVKMAKQIPLDQEMIDILGVVR